MNARIISLCLLCALLFPVPALAQDSLNVTRLAQLYTYWEDADGVVISGSYAYVSDYGAGLHVVDISQPAALREVGRCMTQGEAHGVALSGSYAYLADGTNGLTVINVNAPAAPIIAGHCSLPGEAYAVAISGSFAYVAALDSGLHVVYVADPTNPYEVGYYNPGGGLQFVSVAVAGSIVYTGDGDYGWFYAVDVADSSHPVPTDSLISVFTWPYGLAISGTRLYVADNGIGLTVIDISTPGQLNPIGEIFISYANGVAVSGSYAYVAALDYGLQVVDVQDPGSMSIVGEIDTPGYAETVALSGTTVFVADGSEGLRAVDASSIALPVLLGSCGEFNPQLWAAAVRGSRVYLTHRLGLKIINVATPAAPFEEGSCLTYDVGNDLALHYPYAYVVGASGLHVINVATAAAPVEVGHLEDLGNVEGVAVVGTLVYAAALDSGVSTINVNIPSSPQVLGRFSGNGGRDIAVSGSYAYLASGDLGMRILNISNPANPTLAGASPPTTNANGVAVSYPYVFLADSAGLYVFNVSDTAAVTQVAYSSLAGAGAVTLLYHYAYVAAGQSGFHIYDVADPANPQEIGFYNTAGNAFSVAPAGNNAYVADGDFFGVYNCSACVPVNPWQPTPAAPAHFALYPCHPNPFNATTAISFELRAASYISLKVYDIAGREVVTLVEEWMDAGEYQATFDGSNLASGVYLARLEAGEFTRTQKVVLLK
jgi:hypothetical protein